MLSSVSLYRFHLFCSHILQGRHHHGEAGFEDILSCLFLLALYYEGDPDEHSEHDGIFWRQVGSILHSSLFPDQK